MKVISNTFWFKFSIINLCVVVSLGVLMRYKIGFEFPFFDQKSLQHGHSHFAFSAWITQTLFVLILRFMKQNTTHDISPVFQKLLIANTIISYCMLIAFIIQGYGAFSILFSQFAIFIEYIFTWLFFRELRLQNPRHESIRWIKAALIFNVISSLGTYTLAYMMTSFHINQKLYLASVYFYLHFQYNGWFFFAICGILIAEFKKYLPDWSISKNTYNLFAFTCAPAYLLSVLWLDLPILLYVIVSIAALTQLYAWIRMLKPLHKAIKTVQNLFPRYWKRLFLLIGISVSIKFLLQAFSTIPYISQLAFGFRPVVIAYLHLVLLAIFSLFLLSFIHTFIQTGRSVLNKISLFIFVAGIFINEIILAIQGISSFSYTIVPYINELLFIVSCIMVIAIISYAYSLRKISFSEQ